MAVTRVNSNLLQDKVAGRPMPSDLYGKHERVLFDAVQPASAGVGDPGSALRLFSVENGQHRLILASCVFRVEGFGAGAVSIGHEAYTDINGMLVAENQTAYVTNLSVATDANLSGLTLGTGGELQFAVEGPQIISAWILGADTIPVGARIAGMLVFNRE